MGSFFPFAPRYLSAGVAEPPRISGRKAMSIRRRVGSGDGEKRTVLVALATDPPPGRGHPRHSLRVVPPRRADHRQRNAMRLSALQHLGDLRELRRALPQQPAGPRRPHLARLAGLHDLLRRHLRPPRRTPLLLGPSRTGSVPPGTWAGRELARPRRSPLADDPHDRKAIRRSADRPPRRRRRSLGPRHPPWDRQPHPPGHA